MILKPGNMTLGEMARFYGWFRRDCIRNGEHYLPLSTPAVQLTSHIMAVQEEHVFPRSFPPGPRLLDFSPGHPHLVKILFHPDLTPTLWGRLAVQAYGDLPGSAPSGRSGGKDGYDFQPFYDACLRVAEWPPERIEAELALLLLGEK